MTQTNALDTTENCRYCLMCRHLCPVGNLTHNEALSPHGWAQMVASERRGLLEWNEQSIDALYKCADCGQCESHCVTDQPLPNAIAAARTLLVENGKAPEEVKQLAEMLTASSNLYNGQVPQPPSGKGDIALFIGDEADHFAPGAVEAVLKLLKNTGIEPVLIGRGRNDGLIPSGLGLRSKSIELANATIEDLESTGATTLLVLSPGAFFTFTRIYPERLNIELDPKVEVVEVTSLLADKMESGDMSVNKTSLTDKFAYMDPEHSVRVPSRFAAPRTLMDTAFEGERVELFWRKERSGSGGATGLQFTHKDMADDLTRFRLAGAGEAGVKTVFTEDSATFGRLNQFAGHNGIEVRNLYQSLAGQL